MLLLELHAKIPGSDGLEVGRGTETRDLEVRESELILSNQRNFQYHSNLKAPEALANFSNVRVRELIVN